MVCCDEVAGNRFVTLDTYSWTGHVALGLVAVRGEVSVWFALSIGRRCVGERPACSEKMEQCNLSCLADAMLDASPHEARTCGSYLLPVASGPPRCATHAA